MIDWATYSRLWNKQCRAVVSSWPIILVFFERDQRIRTARLDPENRRTRWGGSPFSYIVWIYLPILLFHGSDDQSLVSTPQNRNALKWQKETLPKSMLVFSRLPTRMPRICLEGTEYIETPCESLAYTRVSTEKSKSWSLNFTLDKYFVEVWNSFRHILQRFKRLLTIHSLLWILERWSPSIFLVSLVLSHAWQAKRRMRFF